MKTREDFISFYCLFFQEFQLEIRQIKKIIELLRHKKENNWRIVEKWDFSNVQRYRSFILSCFSFHCIRLMFLFSLSFQKDNKGISEIFKYLANEYSSRYRARIRLLEKIVRENQLTTVLFFFFSFLFCCWLLYNMNKSKS